MKTLFLADYNNLMYRAIHGVPELTTLDGTLYTNGFFGMVKMLSAMLNKVRATHFAMCDDRKPYLRDEAYAKYKKDRRKEQDPEKTLMVQHTRKLAYEFFERFGINTWYEQGYEADDMIAAGCDKHHEEFDKIVIASNDDDLYQLLKYKNVMLCKGTHNTLYSHRDFSQEFPEVEDIGHWPLIKAMSGTHNGLPGIKGVGMKTAIKIYSDGDKLDETIAKHKPLLKEFMKLITLPYLPVNVPLNLLPVKHDSRSMAKWFDKYDIDFTTDMDVAFERLSSGSK